MNLKFIYKTEGNKIYESFFCSFLGYQIVAKKKFFENNEFEYFYEYKTAKI